MYQWWCQLVWLHEDIFSPLAKATLICTCFGSLPVWNSANFYSFKLEGVNMFSRPKAVSCASALQHNSEESQPSVLCRTKHMVRIGWVWLINLNVLFQMQYIKLSQFFRFQDLLRDKWSLFKLVAHLNYQASFQLLCKIHSCNLVKQRDCCTPLFTSVKVRRIS